MQRRYLLKVLSALCFPPAILAQQRGRQDFEERLKREAEAAEHLDLPIYPRQERAVADAPFSASFRPTIPSNRGEYPVRLWRRSDGSTRMESVLWIPAPVRVEATIIADYERMRTFTFLRIDGALREDSVAEQSIHPESIRVSGEDLIKIVWKTLESENSVILEGVDDRACRRLRLESPYRSKTLDVWISEDLQIILQEELRRNGELQHLYAATSIDRSEPDPSLFEFSTSEPRP